MKCKLIRCMSRIGGEGGCECTLRLIENMNHTDSVNCRTQNMNYNLKAKSYIGWRFQPTMTYNESYKLDNECWT